MKYCESTFKTLRRKSRVVWVGNVPVGGSYPIRLQSMTTSNTRDVDATIEQIMRLADAGCEIARITVQGMKEADACEGIKNGLLQRGYTIPLVADIHFYPPAAMRVIDFVDKVRINPGNFVDKRASFKTLEYTDETYGFELEKIEEKFAPLIEKCIKLKRSMRIGTNHGSLSDRIMNRYGDTPRGMVESALEFTRICRKYDYHDIIFSMKASNPQVMIQAYRLLVAEMIALEWDYPLHLGVTEAGEGEDGRVKSAIGIGALLLDGIGDTIRVSLTEDPWFEIDPCKRFRAIAEDYLGKGIEPFEEKFRNIEIIQRRAVQIPEATFLHRDGTVAIEISKNDLHHPDFLQSIGLKAQLGRVFRSKASVDAIFCNWVPDSEDIEKLNALQQKVTILSDMPFEGATVIDTLGPLPIGKGSFVRVLDGQQENWIKLLEIEPTTIIFAPREAPLHSSRKFFEWLQEQELKVPVILEFNYTSLTDDMLLKASAEMGSLLCDGYGEGILIRGDYPINLKTSLSFSILQGARMRSSKTEFISCPGCGRTLFNLQVVAQKIRERTAHLPGVKIAIMGCIVNGPGEMADADFGYVGSKPGMIDLYVGKKCVQKDIDFDSAPERLVDLIKANGRWVEPEALAGLKNL